MHIIIHVWDYLLTYTDDNLDVELSPDNTENTLLSELLQYGVQLVIVHTVRIRFCYVTAEK